MSAQTLLSTMALLTGLYVAYGGLMVLIHPRFLYPFYQDEPRLQGFDRQLVEIPGADPIAVQVSEGQGGPTVLFFMGNAGAVAVFEEWLQLHSHSGRRVVAMEYRGGGGNPGRPSEARLKADALAVYDWVAAQGDPVVLHGFSLGSGLAMHVAAQRSTHGVILEAPFARICHLMTRASGLPACRMPVQRWDSLSDVPAVTAPVLIVHGDADEMIPITEAEQLAAAFTLRDHPVEFGRISGGMHGNLPDFQPYLDAIRRFLDRI